ncbi:MAG TPA: glutamate--tRNA ligase, partial [Alphaproteobacteria bacterium]|nr:glutamate--tRNA ligase [Alphaproteobacteria bacterium]
MSSVVTRFAPSPTGYLHIGGARTALFNWLYARHMGGKFLLRIEDTDRERSTPEAVAAIINSMKWLGLDWDGDVVFQFPRADRHRAEALRLLAEGKAYHCYASPQELEEMREKARREGRPIRYDGRWRDRDPKEAPPGVRPVVRFKAPREGATIIHDVVQGDVRFDNDQLDDMILLRSDSTPTYMLAVVVDDNDMNVSHVIRAAEHLNNAPRQLQLIRALGYREPAYAHVPLIHGADGTKLSKRHGAVGVEIYRDMGYLPEALRNYLARLGWAHGDDEIFSTQQAIEWFTLEAINKAPARLDFDKLNFVNGYYIRQCDDASLADLAIDMLTRVRSRSVPPNMREVLIKTMPAMKERAKTIAELADACEFLLVQRPLKLDDKAAKLIDAPGARDILREVLETLTGINDWSPARLESAIRAYAEVRGLKLGSV